METIITIKDLQNYRKRHEKLVEQVAVTHLPTKYGDFMAYGYVNQLNGEHHVALVKGEIGDGQSLLCRVHSECLTGDTFGSLRCDCGEQLACAMRQIEKEGRGVVLNTLSAGDSFGVAGLFTENDRYVFSWNGHEQAALLIYSKPNERIRFQWEEDAGTEYFFELQITMIELTGDVVLVVTDFTEPAEKDDTIMLWNRNIEQLKQRLRL